VLPFLNERYPFFKIMVSSNHIITQVNDVRRKTTGSHRMSVKFMRPYPRQVPVSVYDLFPIRSCPRKKWPYVASVSGPRIRLFFTEKGYGLCPAVSCPITVSG